VIAYKKLTSAALSNDLKDALEDVRFHQELIDHLLGGVIPLDGVMDCEIAKMSVNATRTGLTATFGLCSDWSLCV